MPATIIQRYVFVKEPSSVLPYEHFCEWSKFYGYLILFLSKFLESQLPITPGMKMATRKEIQNDMAPFVPFYMPQSVTASQCGKISSCDVRAYDMQESSGLSSLIWWWFPTFQSDLTSFLRKPWQLLYDNKTTSKLPRSQCVGNICYWH